MLLRRKQLVNFSAEFSPFDDSVKDFGRGHLVADGVTVVALGYVGGEDNSVVVL